MKKADVYELRDILNRLKYIKEADTDKSATHDKFISEYKKGVNICTKEINKRKPL